jgi:HSP20 family protein
MAITQYRPSGDLFAPFFEDFFGRPGNGGRMANLLRAPEADVVETEREIQVHLEMPGMKADEIDIGLENNILTISGEKRQERSQEGDRNTWHLTERRYGQFSRSFVLPRDVDADGIQASFEDGVLRVVIPKSEKARRRKIDVASGGGSQRVEAGNN